MAIRSLTPEELIEIYQNLLDQIGHRHWWPAESPFEVIIGAILTQNTSWQNVKKAIQRLKAADLLTPQALNNISQSDLANLIRSSGYYNQKAKKIKHFVCYFVERYDGSIANMARQEAQVLRSELLSLNGIGPETADSILLYALHKPLFVVDAYTRRIFSRHDWFAEKIIYQEMQNFFMQHLNADVELFNEFHALIDYIGHYYCRKRPLCHLCPLFERLPAEKTMELAPQKLMKIEEV